jgi:hypothetical protein
VYIGLQKKLIFYYLHSKEHHKKFCGKTRIEMGKKSYNGTKLYSAGEFFYFKK